MKQEQSDNYYLRLAHLCAENSYAVRLKVGAILVKDLRIIADGFNGTPSGFPNVCEIKAVDGLTTIPYVLHAEANAITKVAKSTESSEGATLYLTDNPCYECSKLIIQCGIKRVVYTREYRIKDGIELLKQAGIKVEYKPIKNE